MISIIRDFKTYQKKFFDYKHEDVTEEFLEGTRDNSNDPSGSFYTIRFSSLVSIDRKMYLKQFPENKIFYEKIEKNRYTSDFLFDEKIYGAYVVGRHIEYYCNFEEARRFNEMARITFPLLSGASYNVYLNTPRD